MGAYGIDSFYIHFYIIYILYATFLYSARKTSKDWLWYVFLVLPLFVLGMCRGEQVGGDLDRYLPYYNRWTYLSWKDLMLYSETKEQGYLFFAKFIGMISNGSNRAYLMITSFVSLIGPMFLFKRYSKNIVITLFLYISWGYYTITFNNVRQSIAISICFMAIPYLFDRKFIKYLLVIMLAFSFHYSAVIMLLLYPLTSFVMDMRKTIYVVIVGLAIYSLAAVSILSFIITNILVKYDPESFFSEQGKGQNLLLLYIAIAVFVGFMYFMNIKKLDEKSQRFFSCLYVCQLLVCILQMFASYFASLARLTYYFSIPICLTIPYMAQFLAGYSRFFYYLCFMALFFFMMTLVYAYSFSTGSNEQAVIPYAFFDTVIY